VVGLAALWSGRYRPRGRAAVIVTGGNIDRRLLVPVLHASAHARDHDSDSPDLIGR